MQNNTSRRGRTSRGHMEWKKALRRLLLDHLESNILTTNFTRVIHWLTNLISLLQRAQKSLYLIKASHSQRNSHPHGSSTISYITPKATQLKITNTARDLENVFFLLLLSDL